MGLITGRPLAGASVFANAQATNEHQEAFDGAVGAYRARNQDVSEKVARRAVERIICNNL
jgi:hypothetical protein